MIQRLLDRRVPQLTGLYLALSWGFVQFVDWAVGQYSLAPTLVNFVVALLLLLLPGVTLLAWRHGKPGEDRWTKTDGAAIGLNLLVAGGVLFAIFGGQPLGAATTAMLIEDGDGNTVERVLPKAEFRRSLLIYAFDNETGDSGLDWLRLGIAFGVELDLAQDVFITVQSSTSDATVRERLAQAGLGTSDRVPLSLKREAAERRGLPAFLAGTIRRDGPTLIVETQLYETRSARQLAERTYRGPGPLALADQISVDLRRDLGVPDWQIEASPDLPAAELATTSVAAFEKFMAGAALQAASDPPAAREMYEAAIALDSTFALAYTQGAIMAALSGDREGGNELVAAASRYLYRLPERYRLAVQMMDRWVLQRDPGGALRTARFWTEVYPQDAVARQIRATLASVTGNREEMIAQMRALLAIDPANVESMRRLAGAFRQDEQYDSALAYYEDLRDRVPNDVLARLDVADVRVRLGSFDEARAELEDAATADMVDPGPIDALARLDIREGRYTEAIERVARAGQLARTAQERATAADLEELLYYHRGQFDSLVGAYRRHLATQQEFAAPIVVMAAGTSSEALRFATEAGRGTWALQQIDSLRSLGQEPFSLVVENTAAPLHVALGNIAAARASLEGLHRMREELGQSRGSNAVIAWVEGRIAELEDGDCDRAMASYEEARDLVPLLSQYRRSWLHCLAESERWSEAEREVEWIVAREPGHPIVRLDIARYYLERGDTAQAVSHLEAALGFWTEADADYRPAQEARELLARYGS